MSLIPSNGMISTTGSVTFPSTIGCEILPSGWYRDTGGALYYDWENVNWNDPNMIKDYFSAPYDPPSEEMLRLAGLIVQEKEERDRLLESMTEEEKEEYWKKWAEDLAKSICQSSLGDQ
jgi:hypothetical protein